MKWSVVATDRTEDDNRGKTSAEVFMTEEEARKAATETALLGVWKHVYLAPHTEEYVRTVTATVLGKS